MSGKCDKLIKKIKVKNAFRTSFFSKLDIFRLPKSIIEYQFSTMELERAVAINVALH